MEVQPNESGGKGAILFDPLHNFVMHNLFHLWAAIHVVLERQGVVESAMSRCRRRPAVVATLNRQELQTNDQDDDHTPNLLHYLCIYFHLINSSTR